MEKLKGFYNSCFECSAIVKDGGLYCKTCRRKGRSIYEREKRRKT